MRFLIDKTGNGFKSFWNTDLIFLYRPSSILILLIIMGLIWLFYHKIGYVLNVVLGFISSVLITNVPWKILMLFSSHFGGSFAFLPLMIIIGIGLMIWSMVAFNIFAYRRGWL
jgi:hypothetical protein